MASELVEDPVLTMLPPVAMVSLPLLLNSMVLLPVLNRPLPPPVLAVFWTLPLMLTVAPSPMLIALVLVVLIVAPVLMITVRLASSRPVPTRVGHGLGAVVVQVVVLADVVQFAEAGDVTNRTLPARAPNSAVEEIHLVRMRGIFPPQDFTFTFLDLSVFKLSPQQIGAPLRSRVFVR